MLTLSAVHPEPVQRRLVPRPGPDPRLRAVRSSSASSPRSGSASGAGWPAAAAPGEVQDIAVWAVPFGLVGGRLYHVATDHELYFGDGGDPVAVALRLAGRARRLGRDRARRASARSSAPGARASGCCRCSTRWRPGVLVAQAHRPLGQLVQPGAVRQADRPAVGAGDRPRAPAAGLRAGRDLPPDVPLRVRCGTSARSRSLIWADRRFRLGHGRVLALYVDGLHARPRLDREPAHRHRRARRRRRPAASTCGPRSCCSSLAAVYFVVSLRLPARPRGARSTSTGSGRRGAAAAPQADGAVDRGGCPRPETRSGPAAGLDRLNRSLGPMSSPAPHQLHARTRPQSPSWRPRRRDDDGRCTSALPARVPAAPGALRPRATSTTPAAWPSSPP